MRLDKNGLKNRDLWESAGFALPQFDRAAVAAATRKNPAWVHFGAGNIFRAYQANIMQKLLNSGMSKQGLVVVEGYDGEIIEKINRPHDDYAILVTLKADGNVEKTVIGSIVESCILDYGRQKEIERIKEIFCKDSLQMVSFTITEKGYRLTDAKGENLPIAESDFAAGPKKPESYMGKVAALLYARYLAGGKPVAMVSMDNCSHNGDRLQEAICTFAEKWVENGKAEQGFLDYVSCKERVSFPWTMIDKITPRPDASVGAILKADGIEGLNPIITRKNTYIAPFVNAEECEYLVMEDSFPNGRPPFPAAGVILTERAMVEKAEKMKVCTCLNPLHTALAIYGCLLGYQKISEEMKDMQLKKLAEVLGYTECLPVAADPGILNPKEFLDAVIHTRLPNPFMPDTPQRIATDTSQKLAVRFGETIKAYQASETLKTSDLKIIPLVFAGWLRYLMAVDDNGNILDRSPDPLLESIGPYVAEMKLGDVGGMEDKIRPILEDKKIFGVNLYEAGIADAVCCYFAELASGIGAVRRTLEKYLG